jgi:excisionase family DNA binding protein
MILYSISETAHTLGVHYETVARWVRTGKLAGVKLSRRKVLVPKKNLEAFLAAGTNDASKTSRGLKPGSTGSPQRWLALAGTLTSKEAGRLRESILDFELVEEGD